MTEAQQKFKEKIKRKKKEEHYTYPVSLVFGVKKLMSEETFSTIKNYYRRINNGESNNYN